MAERIVRRSPLQVQRAVLFALFVRELKTRFGGSWLGAFWVLLEPLAHVLLMMAIFGAIHNAASTIPYPVFLVTGLLPFFIFRSLAFRLMEAIDANRGLFGYRQVKPMDTLISRALLEVALHSVVYLTALAILGWLGYQWLPVQPLELIGTSALLVAFGVAAGVLFAVATNDRPRARTVLRIAAMPLYFVSGVMFPIHAVPQPYRDWLLWNPVLQLIELGRNSFFAQHVLEPGIGAGYVAALTLAIAALALSLYRLNRLRLAAVA